MIDSKGPDFAKTCIDGIAERTERKIDTLINTHHHGDHTGGNPVFRKVVGRIVGHENVPELQRKAAEQRGNTEGQDYPDVTYAKEWSMDLGNETVSLKHLGPAHTGGDSVVHFEKANVVHMGDLIFNRWCPFIDRDGGASVMGWVDTLNRTIEAHDDETIFIFGHGAESFGVTGSNKDLAVQRDYLEWVWEITEKGIAAGKTAEQIAEPGLPEAFSDHVELNERLGVLGNVSTTTHAAGTIAAGSRCCTCRRSCPATTCSPSRGTTLATLPVVNPNRTSAPVAARNALINTVWTRAALAPPR